MLRSGCLLLLRNKAQQPGGGGTAAAQGGGRGGGGRGRQHRADGDVGGGECVAVSQRRHAEAGMGVAGGGVSRLQRPLRVPQRLPLLG